MIDLPELPFAADALEPAVSARTMRLHHDKHQAKYVARVNALSPAPDKPLEALIEEGLRGLDLPLLNNACQAWNHAFFWNCLTPTAGRPADGALTEAIDGQFGGLDGLRQAMLDQGGAHFGSGWVWLVARGTTLSVVTSHDGDTLAVSEWTPLLVCDLWEHAYYLDYQNDRAAYLAAWWDRLANWSFAEAQFAAANGSGVAWTYAEGSRPQPLRTRADLVAAAKTATELLSASSPPDADDDRRLQSLLGHIAAYQSAPSQPLWDEDLARLKQLDAQLRAFGRRWPEPLRQSPLGHWAPALGGDVGLHG